MSMSFDRPAPPGDQFSCELHVGALLVIDVLEHVPPMQTKVSEKPQDAIRANVYVITPQATVGEQFLNTLLFPRMLVARLQQSVGRKVLGVLTGQPGVKRDGRNVPYDLDDPTDAMEQAAVRAMTAHSMASAPPAQQWGQQQAPWGAGQPPAPQQPAPGWGQPPAQQGPPPGWGQQPQPLGSAPWTAGQQPQQPATPPPGWGQQQLPAAEDVPPWEREQQGPPPGWGQQ